MSITTSSEKYRKHYIIPNDNAPRADGGIGRADLLRTSQLLTDEYSVKILVATIRVPKSAQDISDAYGIPIAACYRRIRDLEHEGLIVCTERKLSRQGKRVSYFLSMLKSAFVFFENGHLRVKFELKTGGADQFGTDWHEIPLENDPNKRQKGEDDDEDIEDFDDGSS